jgi:hypothetical protein
LQKRTHYSERRLAYEQGIETPPECISLAHPGFVLSKEKLAGIERKIGKC